MKLLVIIIYSCFVVLVGCMKVDEIWIEGWLGNFDFCFLRVFIVWFSYVVDWYILLNDLFVE